MGRRPRLGSQVSNSNERNSDYREYLEVRPLQTVHKFYEAWRFHGDDKRYSIKALWRVAQKEPGNQAFVSFKDEKAGLWKASRDGGSAVVGRRFM